MAAANITDRPCGSRHQQECGGGLGNAGQDHPHRGRGGLNVASASADEVEKQWDVCVRAFAVKIHVGHGGESGPAPQDILEVIGVCISQRPRKQWDVGFVDGAVRNFSRPDSSTPSHKAGKSTRSSVVSGRGISRDSATEACAGAGAAGVPVGRGSSGCANADGATPSGARKNTIAEARIAKRDGAVIVERWGGSCWESAG